MNPPDPRLDLEGLYRSHRNEVYRASLRKLGDHHDAEDVTQTAFLDAYKAILRGTQPDLPRPWLLAIAENVRRRRFRTALRRPREEPLRDESLPSAEPPWRAQTEEIRVALAKLGESQRKVFLLRELGGFSYGEIATQLDLSVPAVQMLLFRARQRLRMELDRSGSVRIGGLIPVPHWLFGSRRPGSRILRCPACRRARRGHRHRGGSRRHVGCLGCRAERGAGRAGTIRSPGRDSGGCAGESARSQGSQVQGSEVAGHHGGRRQTRHACQPRQRRSDQGLCHRGATHGRRRGSGAFCGRRQRGAGRPYRTARDPGERRPCSCACPRPCFAARFPSADRAGGGGLLPPLPELPVEEGVPALTRHSDRGAAATASCASGRCRGHGPRDSGPPSRPLNHKGYALGMS